MAQYKAGIIGLGRIGIEFPDSHLKAYENCPNIMSIDLFDTDISKGIPYNHEPLDIVSICVPPESHLKVVAEVAPHARAIWLEKPIAETLGEADEIIRLCADNGTLLQVNHQRRATVPRFTFSRGWLNSGTHAVDLLRQLFGEIKYAYYDVIIFRSGRIVDIDYVESETPIFELDCTHSTKPMLGAMLRNIINSFEGEDLYCSGETARESLKWTLVMKEDYEAS